MLYQTGHKKLQVNNYNELTSPKFEKVVSDAASLSNVYILTIIY